MRSRMRSAIAQALDQRLLPFTTSIEAALDKVRGALSTSAQRELLRLVDQLQIVGVPALPIPNPVRAAVETAWFEDRALSIHYRKVAYDPPQRRTVRIRRVSLHLSLLPAPPDSLKA